MRLIFCIFFSFSSLISKGQGNGSVIPQPANIQFHAGQFKFTGGHSGQFHDITKIIFDSSNSNAATFLINYLKKYFDFDLMISKNNDNQRKNKSIIELISDTAEQNESKYRIQANSQKITIKGSPQGIFYGIQTLIQLLPDSKDKILSVPSATIFDSSRFTYRGMHLDVGRHFFSVEFIKKYIDYLAFHKFNTLHWHLTEDQGWRIEIKKYPLLTQTGSCRNQTLVGPYGSDKYDGKKYCGFYTQDEIRGIIKYAAERYINIIPEIEMPGHSMAALTAYPFLGCTKGPYEVMQTWGVSDDVLCAGNDSTFSFLENVLDEVMTLFPSKYIHIGGDECPKERWHECAWCQKRMKDNNLKNEHELQSYFIGRIEKYINKKGRNIIGWDEILEGGLAPNATVMSWRGEEGGIAAAKQKHFAIMTPGTPLYLNSSQSINEDSVTQGGYNSLKMVYDYEPIPSQLSENESNYILGAQGNMWTEYMNNESKVEYMLFPRIGALSEVLWTPNSQRSWKRFEKKLSEMFSRYDFWRINYSKAYFDIQTNIAYKEPDKNSLKKDVKYAWSLTANDKKNKISIRFPDGSSMTSTSNKIDITPTLTGTYLAHLINEKRHPIGSPVRQYFHINKATGKKITLKIEPDKNYAVGGPLTLVDGIQNEKGMSKSSQFLGFWGNDFEAVIDMGGIEKIDSLAFHVFIQPASWIYAPKLVLFFESENGKDFNLIQQTNVFEGHSNIIYKSLKKTKTRFIKIAAQNFGEIPSGYPGAGNKAWLFTDEIEIF